MISVSNFFFSSFKNLLISALFLSSSGSILGPQQKDIFASLKKKKLGYKKKKFLKFLKFLILFLNELKKKKFERESLFLSPIRNPFTFFATKTKRKEIIDFLKKKERNNRVLEKKKKGSLL